MSAVPPSIFAALQASSPLAPLPEGEGRLRPIAKVGVPRLSVVIVNYRQWDKTEELVRHLQNSASIKTGAGEVVIVDNHSPPHPVVKRLRRQSHVSLRRWPSNRGFARAVNEGCRLSQGTGSSCSIPTRRRRRNSSTAYPRMAHCAGFA